MQTKSFSSSNVVSTLVLIALPILCATTPLAAQEFGQQIADKISGFNHQLIIVGGGMTLLGFTWGVLGIAAGVRGLATAITVLAAGVCISLSEPIVRALGIIQ
jgi:hypothetical protein